MNKGLMNKVALMVLGIGAIGNISCMASVDHVCIDRTAGMSDEEKAYIYDLTNAIEEMFTFFQERIMKFVDKTDATPYRTYVRTLTHKMDVFEQTEMVALASKIEQSRQQGSVTCYKGLVIVQEVLQEFMGKLNNLRAILEDYIDVRNNIRKAIELGKRVRPILIDLIDAKTIAHLEGKLDAICQLLNEAHETTLLERMLSIKKIVNNLQSGPSLKVSDAEILSCITTKLRHN
jgi:hypothetical protein